MKIICVLLLICATISTISALCGNLPPGIERVIRGIDMTTLDMVPTDFSSANGFLHPVIEFTCTTGRKWTNPVDPSIVYDVPDQVETINSLPGGIVDFKSKTYQTHSDVKKAMAVSAGVEVITGMFSASGSYKKLQNTVMSNLNTLISMSAYVSAYELELRPYLQQKMSASVALFFNQLPATYLANPAAYQEFLSTFGTHFFSSGTFGGYLTTTIETTEGISQKMKGHQIEVEAAATFMNLIKLHGGYQGQTNKVSDEFKKFSSTHEAYYGGIANLATGSIPNYAAWWTSVPRNPWLFGGQLVPLWHLLPAGPKIAELNTAVNVKLDKAYIDDLLRSIGDLLPLAAVQGRNELRVQKTQLINYQAQLNALKAQPVPNHAQLMGLSGPVEGLVVAVKNTAAIFCMRDKRFCNSPLSH